MEKVYVVVFAVYTECDFELSSDILIVTSDKEKASRCFGNACEAEIKETFSPEVERSENVCIIRGANETKKVYVSEEKVY